MSTEELENEQIESKEDLENPKHKMKSIETDSINNYTRKCLITKKFSLHNFDIIYDLIHKLSIDESYKRMILTRIQRIHKKICSLQIIYKYAYFYSRVFITIASILSPALTAINTDEKKPIYIYLWWVIWNLQISISILTTISTFFKWDRNYFLYSEYKDSVEEEIWHYLECTHNYAIFDQSYNTFDELHDKNINLFLQRLEDLYASLCLKDTEIKLNSAFTNGTVTNSANITNRKEIVMPHSRPKEEKVVTSET